VKRRFRLTRSNDIKRVRRFGKSYAHPLVVLVVTRSENDRRRVALITGKSVGGAVERNLVRRRLRAICDTLQPVFETGFEAVLIARSKSHDAEYSELTNAVQTVFQRAGLTRKSNG
jgi:ribonuclease P protein component